MDAKDEQRSLATTPLPPEEIVKQDGDDQLPSLIYDYDRQIVLLQAQILSLQAARETAITRAATLKIGKDERAKIIVKESLSDREIDLDLFKTRKPEVYEKALGVELEAAKAKIQQQIDKLSKFEVGTPNIRIKTIETMLNKDEIELLCKPRKVTKTYEVLRADAPLPKGKGIKLLSE